MKNLLRVLAAGAALLGANAWAEEASDHFFWRPAAEDSAPRPWAILLPGSSGMSILGDDQHYLRAAGWFNTHGVDALVIDYQGAARYVPGARGDAPAGDRIAAIVTEALVFERAQGRAPIACPGLAIGWSLGAEGVWTLAAAGAPESGIRAAALFYPTVRHAAPYRNAVPMLVLQGQADNVTPEPDLRAFVGARAESSPGIEIVAFPGASHGFDVASLARPRSMRFPPLVGQRVTFAYDAAAEAGAHAALERFMAASGITGRGCAAG